MARHAHCLRILKIEDYRIFWSCAEAAHCYFGIKGMRHSSSSETPLSSNSLHKERLRTQRWRITTVTDFWIFISVYTAITWDWISITTPRRTLMRGTDHLIFCFKTQGT